MLGTAPSGSVQLQDYCVRPEKIGEPYFCYYRLLPQVARTYLCTRNLSDSPVVIAFIGYRCPASSEAFPLRLPSPVYHVLTCIHRKRSHAPKETGAVTVIQSFGDYRNLAPRPFHQEDQPTVVPGRGTASLNQKEGSPADIPQG